MHVFHNWTIPPIIEVFVVWHPEDKKGAEVAKHIFDHFIIGSSFTGIIGGGIQVSMRSTGWNGQKDAPRPIYVSNDQPPPNGMLPARFVAIVPLLGTQLAASVEKEQSAWHEYVCTIRNLQENFGDFLGVFPVQLSQSATDRTKLHEVLGGFQRIADNVSYSNCADVYSTVCRDLAQGITQLISPVTNNRLTVFVSHTRQANQGKDVKQLVDVVHEVIRNTRLEEFIDFSDLQPGASWEEVLSDEATKCAMLAVRTDVYARRNWCQQEVTVAKTSGMPVVMLDAVEYGEERGSFLMDHVPRLPVRKINGEWNQSDVIRAVNLLVNEYLKRTIWLRQREISQGLTGLKIAWWAPHAPEPLTLSHWVDTDFQKISAGNSNQTIRILHPEPPLTQVELCALQKYAKQALGGRSMDIMTPQQMASRGINRG